MTDDFVKFSRDYVLFCHITSRVPGEKHGNLLSEKGGRGFPHMAALDSDGNVIAVHQGRRDPSGFAETMKAASRFMDLVKKAEAGDKAAKFEVLVHRLKMGSLSGPEAEKAAGELGPLSKEQQKTLEGLLADAAVRGVLEGMTRDPNSRLEAGKKFLEMKKAGKPAPSGEREFQVYWILMMDYAEKQKDAATFEEALKALKARFGNSSQAQKFFKDKEEALRKLKEEGKGK